MKLLAKGKRSEVFLITKHTVLKKKRQDSKAQGTIEREYKVLKRLNKQGIGPKVFEWQHGMVMEYIEGMRIKEFLARASRAEILQVLHKILSQLRVLDKLGLNKEEMVNPYKHILITKDEVKLIDFERCKQSKRPQNITQFTSFLMGMGKPLAKKGIFMVPWRLQKLAAKYKHNQSAGNYRELLNEVMQQNTTAKIYWACFNIPKGKVSSYKALGQAAGIKGFRAVGQAMNKNPYAPIVPCHRVVKADGSLGGFASGLVNKINLLKDERVEIINNRIPKKYFTLPRLS